MASNNELIVSILVVDAKAETEGLNNAQLAAKLKELKAEEAKAAKLKELKAEEEAKAAEETKAEEEAKAAEETKAEEEAKAAEVYPYSVPAGKAVTTKRGIISGGEVRASDFEGGEKTLEALVESGHVVKAK